MGITEDTLSRYNPLYQAAKASRMQGGFQPAPAYSPEMEEEPEQAEQNQPSVLGQVANAGLSTIGAVGNLLDLPGSMVRDVASWIPGGTKAQNPFDQIFDPLGFNADKNRIEGRTLLRDHGLVGKKDNWGNFAGGFVAEMALDPASYLGIGVVGRVGNAFKKAGLLTDMKKMTKEIAEKGGGSAKKIKGGAGWKQNYTGARVLDHMRNLRDDAVKLAEAPLEGKKLKVGDNGVVDSLDDLYKQEGIPDKSWAVVDDGQGYKVYEYRLGEDGNKLPAKDAWKPSEKATEIIRQELSGKSTKNTTLNRARAVTREVYEKVYGEGFDEEMLEKPLYNFLSFKAPLLPERTRKTLIETANPNAVFNRRMASVGARTGGTGGGGGAGKAAQGPPGGTGPTTDAVDAVDEALDTPETDAQAAVQQAGAEVDQTPVGAKPGDTVSPTPKTPDLPQSKSAEIPAARSPVKQAVLDKLKPVEGTERARALAQLADAADEKFAATTLPIADTLIQNLARVRGEDPEAVWKTLATISAKNPEEAFKMLDGDLDTLFQGEAALAPFYSKLERVVQSNKVGGKVGWDQLKATLKKSEVKDEEIEDLDLESLFKDGKPKTKQEINDWIDENRLDIETVEDSKFHGYQIPGGDEGTYREILIKTPQKTVRPDTTGWTAVNKKYGWDVYDKDGKVKFAELYADSEADAILKASGSHAKKVGPQYTGPHFDETNIVAHLRADDVTLTNGKKALRVQELQSDWHQKGRSDGWRPKSIEELVATERPGTRSKSSMGDNAIYDVAMPGGAIKVVQASTPERAAAVAFDSARVPDGPFKKSWGTLGLKHVIKEAVEKGYDEVHIVKGSDAAKAVGGPEEALGTFYDSIVNSDMKKLTKKWGSFQGIGNNALETPRWRDDMGSDFWGLPSSAADKNDLLGGVTKKGDTFEASLSPYHNPNKIDNKSFKTLDEAKKWIDSQAESQRKYSGDVQVFKVTPEMKKDVLEQGQPLYQNKGKNARAAITPIGTKHVISLFEKHDASSALHELAHFSRKMLPENMQKVAQEGVEEILKRKLTKGWDTDAEEAFAKEFENYLTKGKAPTAKLKKVFEQLKEFMLSIYEGMRGTEIKINPKLEAIFDELLGKKGAVDDLGKPKKLTAKEKAKLAVTQPINRNPLQAAAAGTKALPVAQAVGDVSRIAELESLEASGLIGTDEALELDALRGTKARQKKVTPVDEEDVQMGWGSLNKEPAQKAKPNPLQEAASPATANAATAARAARDSAKEASQEAIGEAYKLLESADLYPGEADDIIRKARHGEKVPEEFAGHPAIQKLRETNLQSMQAQRDLEQSWKTQKQEPTFALDGNLPKPRDAVDEMAEKAGPKFMPGQMELPFEDAATGLVKKARGRKAATQPVEQSAKAPATTPGDTVSRFPESESFPTQENIAKQETPIEAPGVAPAASVADVVSDVKSVAEVPPAALSAVDKLIGMAKKMADDGRAPPTNKILEQASRILDQNGVTGGVREELLQKAARLQKVTPEPPKAGVSDTVSPPAAAAVEPPPVPQSEFMPFLEEAMKDESIKAIAARVAKRAGLDESGDILGETSLALTRSLNDPSSTLAQRIAAEPERAQELIKKQAYLIARNKGADTLRERVRMRDLSNSSGTPIHEAAVAKDYADLIDDAGLLELKDSVIRAAGAEAYEILKLISEGVSQVDIAKQLGKTDGAVRAQVTRARDAIRKAIDIKRRDVGSPEMQAAIDAELNQTLEGLSPQAAKEAEDAARKTAVKDWGITNFQSAVPDPIEATKAPIYVEAIKKALAATNTTQSEKWDSVFETLEKGEHLFFNNPVMRRAYALFDRATFGGVTEEEQLVAREKAAVWQQSIYDMREKLTPIVNAIAKTNVLSEDAIMADAIQNSKVDKKAARSFAQKLVHDRHVDIVRYLEGYDALRTLDEALFQDPSSRVLLQDQLDVMQKLMDAELMKDAIAGLDTPRLRDANSKYFPRILQTFGRPTTISDRGEEVFNTAASYMSGRRKWTRDIKDGRAVLDDMSVDTNLSGAYWRQPVLGDGVDRTLQIDGKPMDVVDYLKQKQPNGESYADRILSPQHYDGNTINKLGEKKLLAVGKGIMRLDASHAERNIPMYGRNFLHDLAQRLELGHAKRGVASAAQEMAIRSAKERLASGVTGQQHTVTKLFDDIKLNNPNAFKNVIDGVGQQKEYAAFAKGEIETIKKQLTSGNSVQGKKLDKHLSHEIDGEATKFKVEGDDLYAVDFDDEGLEILYKVEGTNLDEQIEKAFNVPRKFVAEQKLTVDEEAYQAATRFLKVKNGPEEFKILRGIFQATNNLFKTHVTLPFLAFHGRNMGGGQMQNYFYGAFDAALGSSFMQNPATLINQAKDVSTGRIVKGLYKQLPKYVQDQVTHEAHRYEMELGIKADALDAAATQWVREKVFKYGLTGDKQGYSAERLGQAASSTISQIPGAQRKDGWFGVFRNPAKDSTWAQSLNPLEVAGSGKPVRVPVEPGGVGELVGTANPNKKQWTWEHIDESKFIPIRAGEDMAEFGENLNRVTAFLGFVKQGMADEVASTKAMQIHFDYSDMSEFSKQMRNVFPFWSYTSKVIPLTFGDLLTNPAGKQAIAIRATNRAQDNEKPVPESLKRSTSIPIGTTASGADRYLTGFGLGYEDALSFTPALQGDMKNTASEVLSRTRPEIQAFIELATGKSLFNGRDLNDADPGAGRLLSNLAGGTADGKQAEPILGSRGLEFMLGKTPASRYLSTANTATDQRRGVGVKAMQLLSGVKIQDVEPWQQERIAIDQHADALKELGGKSITNVSLPSWAKQRLSPEDQQKAEAIQAFISETRKAGAKKRKEAEEMAASLNTLKDD